MLHLKRILKSILKYKTSSGLTLLSLIIAFTGIIILALYVSWEKSFDKFHENADSVYRLETSLYNDRVPAKIGKIIRENVPEVEKLTALWSYSGKITTPKLNETNVSFQKSAMFAEESFLEIFTFPLKIGDKETVLKDPHSAVVSESFSKALFGDINPVGENIIVQDIQYVVTGVMKDFPKNSSLQTDCLLSFSTYKEEPRYSYFDEWSEWSFNIFFSLVDGATTQSAIEKINEIEIVQQIKEEMSSQQAENEELIKLYFSLSCKCSISTAASAFSSCTLKPPPAFSRISAASLKSLICMLLPHPVRKPHTPRVKSVFIFMLPTPY